MFKKYILTISIVIIATAAFAWEPQQRMQFTQMCYQGLSENPNIKKLYKPKSIINICTCIGQKYEYFYEYERVVEIMTIPGKMSEIDKQYSNQIAFECSKKEAEFLLNSNVEIL